MSTPELKQFIASELARGVSPDDLRQQLRAHGWQDNDIEIALAGGSTASVAPAAPSAASAVRLYNPLQYSIVGFLLSFVPVFFMSWSNSKHLANGAQIRSALKKFIIASVALVAADIGLYFWASAAVARALTQALKNNPIQYLETYVGGGASGVADLVSKDPSLSFARTVVQSANVILFAVSLAILILTVRFTNKNEVPEYQKLKQAGRVQVIGPWIPIVIGLAIVSLCYFVLPSILAFIAKKML